MHGLQRKVLEDNARLGKICRQHVHIRLDSLAVRALEVGKLHQFQIFRSRSAIGPGSALRQQRAVLGVGMGSERDDLIVGEDVPAVGQGIKLDHRGLLLAGLVADEHQHLAHSRDLGLADGLHLPNAVFVVAPTGLDERVDLLFGGRDGGELRWVGLGKHRRCRGNRG